FDSIGFNNIPDISLLTRFLSSTAFIPTTSAQSFIYPVRSYSPYIYNSYFFFGLPLLTSTHSLPTLFVSRTPIFLYLRYLRYASGSHQTFPLNLCVDICRFCASPLFLKRHIHLFSSYDFLFLSFF